MGTFVFKLPDIGEGTAEAEIVKWHVKAGDEIGEEQPLVDLMTDKATVEIASPVTGRIMVLNGEEGTKAAVGSALVIFEVVGGGDVPEKEKAKLAPPAPLAKSGPVAGKGLASPAVRGRAKTLGIDLATVTGTGPGGVILHSDLDRVLMGRPGATAAPVAVVIGAKEEGVEDIRVFGLRRRIAERMLDATRRIPHFTYIEEVDVSALEALRQTLNACNGALGRLTMLPFLIRALIKSVHLHPGVNAHFDDGEDVIRQFRSVHAGIATQTERGLLVPVIHHAEAMGLYQLAAEIARLSEAARAGKSSREDLVGSTITVTSLGALGGIAATPIINPPEVAIVGVNRMAERAVVRDGAVVIAKMMNLSSSFDHRIVDGHAAAAFIKSVKDELEAPASLDLAGA